MSTHRYVVQPNGDDWYYLDDVFIRVIPAAEKIQEIERVIGLMLFGSTANYHSDMMRRKLRRLRAVNQDRTP